MQLASRTCRCPASSSSQPAKRSRRSCAHVLATAAPDSSSSSSFIPQSPSFLDRPAGGGSRSYDLPPSSDVLLSNWGARSDFMRPSGGANRGPSLPVTASSVDRPGGRGGRGDLPPGWDTPATPQDPAQARPGGRGGRELGLGSFDDGGVKDPALGRPGGRGGRDIDFTPGEPGTPVPPVSLDRPGGRGGRDSFDGGDSGSGGGGSSGGGGGGGDSSGGAGGGGEGDGFSAGKAFGSVLLYGGVIAAAWAGHKAFFAKPAAPEPEKSCCGGKASKGDGDKKGKKK